MVKIVLTSDRTLMSEFRNLPNADFYACAPADPQVGIQLKLMAVKLFDILAQPIQHLNGVALRAPYGLRKLEAALLRGYDRKHIAVVDPDYVEHYIGSDTSIVAISTMDPLGMSPLTLVASHHGRSESFASRHFRQLTRKLFMLRRLRGFKYRIVVGGSGALEFTLQPHRINELNIDYVIYGEIDNDAHLIFRDIENGVDLPQIIYTKEYNKKHGLTPYPKVDEIPSIVMPSIHNLVEVMRGCGRNCSFCESNLRAARYYPFNKIEEEIALNVKYGARSAWLQSDDIFLYGLEDHKDFYPNRDAILELFRMVMSIPGIRHSNATHGTIAPAAADPDLIRELSEVLRAGPNNWIGIQTGLETGSPRLFEKWMPLKGKPFSPEEWPDVIFDGTAVFNENYWYPVYTMITGLPGETDDDVEDSIELLKRLEYELPRKVGKEKAHFFIGIFPFLNWGIMKGEEPFDLKTMMTRKRLELFRLAYRHMVRELTMPPRGVLKGPWLNLGFRLIGPVGYYYLSNFVEKVLASYEREIASVAQLCS